MSIHFFLFQRNGGTMFTAETQLMDIIIENVKSEKVKSLFYHMLIDYEVYKSTIEMLGRCNPTM